jgi:Fe-S-cluster containining protein
MPLDLGVAPEKLPRMEQFDCRTCGACCMPERRGPMYVGLEPIDEQRLSPRWRAAHVAHQAILTKLDPVGRCVCVALRGTVGAHVSCTVYARRPDQCRMLEAGTAECRKARRQAGLGSRLTK